MHTKPFLKYFLALVFGLIIYFPFTSYGQTYSVTTLSGDGTAGSSGNRFNSPSSLVADGNGTIYVADQNNHWIRTLSPTGSQGFLAGGSQGFVDGSSRSSRFNTPTGITRDNTGNLYIADRLNHRIRKITFAPTTISTVAGNSTEALTNGNGASASFNDPVAVVLDASENIYVSDFDNHCIRKITPSGDVTTLAGSGSSGSDNGTGSNASFSGPSGLAVDGSGNIYVADQLNHLIRKITPAGVVTTFAGSGTAGSQNGTGTAATFNAPFGLVFDANYNLYVSEISNHLIRKISPTGVVTTVAGSGTAGFVNGDGLTAQFNSPAGLTIDASGNLYVADYLNHSIRKITITCIPPATPTISGNNTFNVGGSTTLTSSSATGNLWSNGATTQSITVSSIGSYSVRIISNECTSAVSNAIVVDLNVSAYSVTTVAGSQSAEFADGIGTAASFNFPNGVVQDNAGNLYVADGNNHRIRKINPDRSVTTLAGSGAASYADGLGADASFNNPVKIAIDASGNLYTADYINHRIRKISPAGVVTTLAGSGTAGYVDAAGTAARFNYPNGVAVDGDGNVYVADGGNHRIRKISTAGVVTTLAGSGFTGSFNGGFADGAGTEARFNNPGGLAVDSEGNVYVADQYNHRIRKINSTGVVTTYAGSGTTGFGNGGFTDGSATTARFNNPASVAVDGAGNIYVADQSNHRIRKISTSGSVTTLAGTGSTGLVNGLGSVARFWNPNGLVLDGQGNIYLTENNNQTIRKLSPVSCTTPATPTISGNNFVCSGSSTVLTSSAATGNLWSTGATTQSITVNSAGDYSVRVIDGTCTSEVSSTVSVSVTPLPATPTISGTNTFCAGGSTILTSSAVTGNLWSTGATTQSITVTSAGNFTVRVIDGACTSEVSATTAVTMNSLPTTPTINSTGGTQICIGENTTLSAGVADGYLWSNGSTMPTITVGAGTYSVRTINASGCTSMVSSDIFINAIACQNVFTGTGTYGTSGNWSTNAAPLSTEDAVIDGIATLTGNVTVNNLTVNAGRSIEIPSGLTLTVTGNVSNLGTISGEGTLRLGGTNLQTFGGGTISNLLIENSDTAKQVAITRITNELRLGNNQVLNLNSIRLTLISDMNGTARIAAVPSSSSIINRSSFNQQRWLDRNNVRSTSTGNTGNYYLIGPVVQGQRIDYWNSVTPYNSSTYAPSSGTGNVYLMQPSTGNWIKPNAPSQPINSGMGAQVWFGINYFFAGANNTLSMVGSPVVGNYNFPITSEQGYHLVSNPYPSTIDWDSPDWIRNNINNAIYNYDWVAQTYITYVNGIGVNGGTRYIATAQGFLVFANNNSPVLTATENIKVSNQVAMQRTESNVNGLIRLAINNNGVTDEMVIANRNTATLAFEADQDAQKMMNPTTNIFVSGAVNQSIASMNLNEVNSIPFVLQTNSTGTVSVSTTELSGLEGYTLNLFNEQTGELLPYTGTETYTFSVTANQPYRLQLRVGSVTGINTFKASNFEVFPNPATNKVTVNTIGTGTLEILNTIGQIIISQPATTTNEINISKLAKGVYTVRFNGISKKLVVK